MARAYIPSLCLSWSRFCPDRDHLGPCLGDTGLCRGYVGDIGLYRGLYRHHGPLAVYLDHTCHLSQAKAVGAHILEQT